MRTWLVDTGPLVAYLDPSDAAHLPVSSVWDRLTGRTATSSAVITEAMHLVGTAANGPRRLAELVDASSMEVFDLCRAAELRAAVTLMERYADTPMDFADATLVLLAEALDVDEILTLDRRGFSTYRTRDDRPLRNMLDTP